MNPPYGDVIDRELCFIYSVTDASIDVAAENVRTMGQVKKYLDWLRPSAEQLHIDLRNLVRSLIAQRKQQIAAHAQVVSSLGIPIKQEEVPPELKTAAIVGEQKTTQIRRQQDRWDFFISHASEDKEAIARPLAAALIAKGKTVWYDDFSLKMGDSLRESIDCGLGNSSFGIVILSPHFFEKDWPKKELDGLAAREVNGTKVILPVWHEVGFNEVRQYSPTLAGRVAASSNKGLEYVVEKILDAAGAPPSSAIPKSGVPREQQREAIRRKLTVVRINAWQSRLTIWVTNRSDATISVKSASMYHGQKRLSHGVPSDGRKFVDVRPNTQDFAIAFTTDADAMLKLQSWGVVDRHLPIYTSIDDVDIEVRFEYDVAGVEDECREPIRVRVHGSGQIESL